MALSTRSPADTVPIQIGGGLDRRGRFAGGGPAGRAPLIRAMRTKHPDTRRIACGWHDRFERDRHSATAELVSLILIVADVTSHADLAREDVEDREPQDVMQQLVASLALEASEKGADFTQHWLVSRERGAQRLRDNYPGIWREVAATASPNALQNGLLRLLRDWTLALSECQFRSVRHAATVAALHIVEGLGIQCNSLKELSSAAGVQILDAETNGASSRYVSLTAESEQAEASAKALRMARDAMGVAILSRRTKDVDHEIRRSCFEALRNWAVADVETFLTTQWTRYLHFGLSDRDPKTRSAVLRAVNELLKYDPSVSPASVQIFVEHIRPRVLSRCHDVDPQVGSAAIKCVVEIAARNHLAEDDFDPVIDLVWDEDRSRSAEAANFVVRFVFSQDVLDLPTGGVAHPPANVGGSSTRKLQMVLDFIREYSDGHYELSDRLVASLWRRTSCLEDWESIASMAIPGCEHSLSGDMHTVLIHVAEAVVGLAIDDAYPLSKSDHAPHAEAVLDRAARAFAPRLPALLNACQAEPAAMRRATSFARHILAHCSNRRGQSGGGGGCDALMSGPHGEAVAEALKTAFMRQPDPETLEYVAEAMAYLLDLSERARTIVLDLTSYLNEKMVKVVMVINAEVKEEEEEVPTADALLSVATRLRILAKAVDVSLCQVRGFLAAVLGLLDDRADAASKGLQSHVNPLLTVTLLEMAVIVLMRQTAALVQPDPLPHCVVHDPVNQEELKLVPIAVKDFFKVATDLLNSDPIPQVKSAALASSTALLTAWANAVRFTEASKIDSQARDIPWAQLTDDLAVALCNHLGELLTEANTVPPDCGRIDTSKETGTSRRLSSFSQAFEAMHRAIMAAMTFGISDTALGYMPSDTERVRIAYLACKLVGACPHPEVADSNLPAVVLTQALSGREDLQAAAWELLGRLRKEANAQTESAAAFFKVMMHAVHMVHRDAGVEVARDLSYKLLQHTGVGKLSLGMQVALVAALQAGVQTAMATETSPGFLEALVPWVTKHLVEDAMLMELAAWVQTEATSFIPDGSDPAEHAVKVGVQQLVNACHATASRGGWSEQASKEPPAPTMAIAGAPNPKIARTTRASARCASTVQVAAETEVLMTQLMESGSCEATQVDPSGSRSRASGHSYPAAQQDGDSDQDEIPTYVKSMEIQHTQVLSSSAGGILQTQQLAPAQMLPPREHVTASASSKRRKVVNSQASASQRRPAGPARALAPEFSAD